MIKIVAKFSDKQNRALAIGQSLRSAICAEAQLKQCLKSVEALLGKEAPESKIRASVVLAIDFIATGISGLRDFSAETARANKRERDNLKKGELK